MDTFTTVSILVALMVGLTLTTGFHVVYKANARGLGLVEIAPWRQRLSAVTARVTGWGAAIASIFRTRQPLIAATLALALCLAYPSADTFAGVALIGVVGNIDTMQADLDVVSNQCSTILAAANGRLMTAAERTDLESLIAKGKAIRSRLDRERGDLAMTAELARLTAGMTSPSRGGGRGGGGSSIGQQFIDSEAGQYLLKYKGKFPTGAWTSPASDLMAATLSEDTASGGDLVVTDYQPGILPFPLRPPRLEDLIAPGQTDSNLIGYMLETSVMNAAAAVAEGAPKPESTLVFDAVTDSVRKIPTWLPVTDEMLEDVPTLRSYIDARLRMFVNLALDDQLLNGSIVPPDIIGFLNRTGLAASVARTGSMTNADAVLDQISAIEASTFLAVDGIVMHPTNWKMIQQSKDGNGQYYGGGPLAIPARPVLWGRPVAVTSVIALGTALVGAFRMGSQLFNRGGVRVEASNSHSDFFVRNLVAIRAERRAALAVYRPSAFGAVVGLS